MKGLKLLLELGYIAGRFGRDMDVFCYIRQRCGFKLQTQIELNHSSATFIKQKLLIFFYLRISNGGNLVTKLEMLNGSK